MRILIVGDPHGKITNIKVFRQFLEILLLVQERQAPDLVVILGDLFDTHAIIRSEILNLWIRYLKRCKIRHILLKGNHDEVGPKSSDHALGALSAWATIADEPLEVASVSYFSEGRGGLTEQDHAAARMVFLPYVDSPDKFQKMLEPYQPHGGQLLFCHQSFNGAKFHNGFYDPYGIPIEWVQNWKYVVVGHIHNGQELANIWYPGTPLQHNFADSGEEKSLWLLDTVKMERTKIPVDLPGFVQKEFTSAGEVVGWLQQQDPRHAYKVVLSDTRSAIAALRESQEYRDLRRKSRIEISSTYTDKALVQKISDALTKEQMLQEYIGKYLTTDLDRDRLLGLCQEFLRGI